MIYAESTPNPATMKFVANRLLVDQGITLEFDDYENADDSPLAQNLLNFPFIDNVFIAANFVTLTKNQLCEWEDVALQMREHIQEYLRDGNRVVSENATSQEPGAAGSDKPFGEPIKATNETEQKIIDILDEYVQPAVAGDGGAIHFESYSDGVLTVTMRGACSGCPSSTATLQNGIKGLFERMMPEVKEIVSVNG